MATELLAGWGSGDQSREPAGPSAPARRSPDRRRVDLDADGVELAARAQPLQVAERARQRRPCGARHPDDDPATRSVARPPTGPSTSAPGGAVEQRERVVDRPGLAGDRGEPRGRRQVRGRALGDLARGEARRVPAHQRLQRRVGRRRRPRPPGRRGRDQRRGVGPAAQRLLGGAQVGAGRAAARCRAARRRRSRRSATGSAPGVATTIAGLVVDRRRARASPLEVRTRVPGKARPSSSAVRASPSTGARRPRCAALRAGPGRRPAVPHQRQAGGSVGRGQRAAGREQVGAAGRRAAALAGQGRGVAGARGLHQHRARAAAPSRIASWTSLGHPGRRGRAASRSRSRSVAPATRDRDALAQHRRAARRARAAQPVRRRYSASTLRAKPPTSAARLLALGAQQQHLAGVRVRRPRLGVQVVAVVPDRHQPEVVDRRERGGAGADHDPAAPRG